MTKVLIVDDEELLTHVYKLGLEKAGFSVMTANRSNAAIDILTKGKADIILLDMLMPDINGVELLKMLKTKKLLGKAKIIIFTNIENPEVINAAKKLGANDYILKVEYTPDQLATYLKKLSH